MGHRKHLPRTGQPHKTLEAAGLKARYKQLVKKHHPDANGGDKKSEEKMRAINEAWLMIAVLTALALCTVPFARVSRTERSVS